MTDLDMWSGIVGFAVPPLVSVFVQSSWPAWARAVFAFAVCMAGGGVTAALTGYLEGAGTARAALVVLFSALTFYRTFWHPSKIATMIETKTNLSGDPGPEPQPWQRSATTSDPMIRSWPPK